MHILIAGGTGLIGTALATFLRSEGHYISILSRKKEQGSTTVYWNPELGELDCSALMNVDAIVNLAGAGIADRRWSNQRKKTILQSRVAATTTIVEAVNKLQIAPKVILSASAIGFYGNGGATFLDETSPAGKNFLSETALQWEAPLSIISNTQIRILIARFGVVLAPHGGALEKMLFPFKLGLGGKLGSGAQYMSWIHIKDCVRAMAFLLSNVDCAGIYNLTTPNPVTNEVFTKSLGKVLNRPTFCSVPSAVLKIALGQMAEELLLSGARVFPNRLLHHGFSFSFPDIEQALEDIISG